MPQSGKQARSVHIRRDAERRVHQHDGRRDPLRQEVIDLLGIEAKGRGRRKQALQNSAAQGGEFVENKHGAPKFGMNGQKSGACRGLDHDIEGRKPCRPRHGLADADWGRELLQANAVLGTPGVRGQKVVDPADQGGELRRIAGLGKKRLAERRRNRTQAASEAS